MNEHFQIFVENDNYGNFRDLVNEIIKSIANLSNDLLIITFVCSYIF